MSVAQRRETGAAPARHTAAKTSSAAPGPHTATTAGSAAPVHRPAPVHDTASGRGRPLNKGATTVHDAAPGDRGRPTPPAGSAERRPDSADQHPDRAGRRPIKVVAFGGGHGLSASLRALRRIHRHTPLDITAVVTVADDGGSSGRLRATRDILPPGDLRQALAALADEEAIAEVFQHRFGGTDDLTGHPVGNLVLCALMELAGDPVVALDQAAAMLRCDGRVLPMSRQPLHIEADLSEGGESVTVRGQHAVAVTLKTIDRVRLVPAAPEACVEAVRATTDADWLLFGPGSWFTSVIPHLLVPQLAGAISMSAAKRLVNLNLAPDSETAGLTLPEHLAALRRYLPGLHVDVVLADGKAVGDPEPVHRAAESLGARLVLAPVAAADGAPLHDPHALATALAPLLSSTTDSSIEPREVTTEWR